MAQDTLASDESVIKEFSDGGRVVKVGSWNADHRYDAPDGDGGYTGQVFDRERTAKMLGKLRAETRYATGDTQIPISVVTEGKKAVAAYLYTECGLAPGGIARKMGLAESTAHQYLTDYLKGR
jgi:hypothetical protein